MITAALLLAVACTELGGETRELAWLIYDRDGPLSVLPLTLGAMEIGTAAICAKTASDLEAAQVVHDARTASAIVVTYDPDRYPDPHIDVVNLRPQHPPVPAVTTPDTAVLVESPCDQHFSG